MEEIWFCYLHWKEQENKANAAKDRQQAQFVSNTFVNIAKTGKKAVGGANSGAQEAIDPEWLRNELQDEGEDEEIEILDGEDLEERRWWGNQRFHG